MLKKTMFALALGACLAGFAKEKAEVPQQPGDLTKKAADAWEAVDAQMEEDQGNLEDAIEDGDKVNIDYDDLTGRTQITIRNRHTGDEMVMELHENGMWVEKNTTTWEEKEVEQLEIVTDTLPATPAIVE